MPTSHGRRAGPHAQSPLPPAKAGLLVLADEHTGLQQVRIVRHPVFGGQLYLDGDLQISESDSAYGVAMVSPLLGLSQLSRIAILGGGDGGVLQELLRSAEPRADSPREIRMVEIDARVVGLCREHLPAVCGDAFTHPGATLVIGDAFAWIARARDLDAVVYDLTMDPVREGQSREDFIVGIVAMMARALRPGGVLSMQCCGHGRADADDRVERRRLLPLIREAVDAHFVDRCEQDVLVPSYRDLWTFLSARTPAGGDAHNSTTAS
jgi:spermidine synthase/spermine synthase